MEAWEEHIQMEGVLQSALLLTPHFQCQEMVECFLIWVDLQRLMNITSLKGTGLDFDQMIGSILWNEPIFHCFDGTSCFKLKSLFYCFNLNLNNWRAQRGTSQSIPWKRRLFVQIGPFLSLFELIVKEMVVLALSRIRAIKPQLNEIIRPL